MNADRPHERAEPQLTFCHCRISAWSFRCAIETSEPGIQKLLARDSGFALVRAPE
jgi:hypothetical protein